MKRVERRDRVYEAAIELFVERGFDSVSMDEIAQRSGHSRSTVFKHFPRKTLFLEEWMRRRREEAARAARIDGPAGRALRDVLGSYFATLAQLNSAARAEMCALVPPTLQHTTGLVNHPVALDLTALTIESEAVLRPSIHPDQVGRLLALGYVSAMARWVEADPPAIDLGDNLAGLLDLVLLGALPDATRQSADDDTPETMN
ncbi:TetR/AcrR family transcriptional regulator [Mycobacterium sp. 21AC1]|uniref:TetR/AcrR family transcriptional regulator n=1 Tax=[Mycobacterium] appelbergii TaxID=2939269 RepID=UPI002938F1D0|nr:helix-turn-helix domain-containing protein [Mycobacterium sp. 21AC1]MDV3126497.1 TetR/AcrR family transcriptional regulator [Mycobacterium sp. 21AC1]